MVASVLLNFTNGVDFIPTDPLMGMVRTGARLLSYDPLSIGRFHDMGTDDEKHEYIKKKVAQLRNMLENRSLSSEDQGERIRLIVVLDFKPWGFLKQNDSMESNDSEENVEFDAAFPSLKVDHIIKTINDVFGSKNPLIERMDFDILFVDDNRDKERSTRYRLMSYHGYYMTPRNNCLSVSSFGLNKIRDKKVEDMDHPDANKELTEPSLSQTYNSFLNDFYNLSNLVKQSLKTIGKEAAFADTIQKALNVRTVKDFMNFDYDDEIKNNIINIAGLGANRFRNCTFFILNMRQNIASQKSKDEIALKSLVQLLCTMDDEQYKKHFRPLSDNDFHKLFITTDPEDNHFNRGALKLYSDNISRLGEQIGGIEWWNPESALTGMKWDSSKKVEYYVYQPLNANAEGGHQAQNEIVDEIGSAKQKTFKEKRKVPFFFGIESGDWQWYRNVTHAFDDCLQYERGNNRPIVENLTRDSDSEQPRLREVCNYAELGERIKKYSINDIKSKVDYETYIHNRKEKIEKLAIKSEEMKKELVKLGFRSRLIWILFLSSLAFTLCFAYHFFYDESLEHPLWIAAGFAGISLVLIIGTFIAQSIVKNKINSVYQEIDNIFYELKKLANDHLKSVNDLAQEMNEADANRKTLSEMKTNYEEWNRHNKKVETWVNFSRNMNLVLENYLSDITFDEADSNQETEGTSWIVDDGILDSKPCIVPQIWSQNHFCDMKPVIEVSPQNKKTTINNITCFISHFKFLCVQK